MAVSKNSKMGRAMRGKTRQVDWSDPRFHIAAAYDNLQKSGLSSRVAEFEDQLNQVNGPDAAIRLARKYSKMKAE